MTIRKDKIIVVDLEATCWEGHAAPPGQENEIIEIGVCLLTIGSGKITEQRGIFVQPIASEISAFCTSLTTITPQQIAAEGVPLVDACAVLEDVYDSRNRLWASWGSFDRKLFWQQCKKHAVRYPFSRKHANLKRVFQDAHKERMGFARALDAVGLEMQGTHHRGMDDAVNTARLLAHLIDRHSPVILKKYGL